MPSALPALQPLGRGLAVLTAATALLGGALGTAQAASRSDAGSTVVDYLGRHFSVPRGWDVVDLAKDPTTCVRFDRHAVYLGAPGAQQNCPPRLIGRTEALVLEPAPSGDDGRQAVTANETGHEMVSTAHGIRATATYDEDQALVRTILRSGGLADAEPRQKSAAQAPAASAARAATAGAAEVGAATARTATAGAELTNHTGKGFDTCAAPDSETMSAWKEHSPYSAVGIYIGGRNRACDQSFLNAEWVRRQASAGWKFIPIYVGTQAKQITSPAAEGRSAADDAVNNAAALGLGPGSLLYFDMEAYPSAYSGNVLAFLSAWTEQIHARGYNSAVYSSSSSGIADLAAHTSGYTMPDVVYTANWNGVADTSDPKLPGWAWANHQRVHQYSGNVYESWGGKRIQIDGDYLDVQLGSPTAHTASRAGVYRPGESVFYVSGVDGGLAGHAGFGAEG
ncbi:DUF1906 domain-containing protein, partial [Streptomyces sp. NRRL S-244]|uniref:DUF1906 domain-containing protein n=1 Tax=Streptomyces sp. NRRL S-244 TaxID=1463897 RepID=UPI00068D0F21